MDIKKKLKNRRLELGLTMEDVGKAVGVSKSTVSKWESGHIENMRRDKIALYAKTLDVSPEFIMGLDEDFDDKTSDPIKEKKEAARQYMQDELHRIGVLPKTEEITPERFESFLRSYEYFLKIFKESTGEDS